MTYEQDFGYSEEFQLPREWAMEKNGDRRWEKKDGTGIIE